MDSHLLDENNNINHQSHKNKTSNFNIIKTMALTSHSADPAEEQTSSRLRPASNSRDELQDQPIDYSRKKNSNYNYATSSSTNPLSSASAIETQQISSSSSIKSQSLSKINSHSSSSPSIHKNTTQKLHLTSQLSLMQIISFTSCWCLMLTLAVDAATASEQQVGAPSVAAAKQPVAQMLLEKSSRLARKFESSSHGLNDWFLHQVAPVMASKLIDNMLHTKSSSSSSASSSSSSGDSAKADSPIIDTHKLADKIVDKLAEGIKAKKSKKRKSLEAAEQTATTILDKEQHDAITTTTKSDSQENKPEKVTGKKSARQGKSLIGDRVQQVMENLIGKDPSRNPFARAMEKRGPHQQQQQHHHHNANRAQQLALAQQQQQHHHHHHQNHHQASNNNWQQSLMPSQGVKPLDPTPASLPTSSLAYELTSPAPSSVSNAAMLDDHPVILTSQHNFTTMTPPGSRMGVTIIQRNSQSSHNRHSNNHNNKYAVLSNHRQQQQQHHGQPWTTNNHGLSTNRRQPVTQQSPYSYPSPVTSDMNIVQATSVAPSIVPIIDYSPQASNSIQTITSSLAPPTTTTTSTTTTTPASIITMPSFSFVPNKHQQQNHHKPTYSHSRHQPSSHRHPYAPPTRGHHQTTSTSTTTTTTTPEPPPQTTQSEMIQMDGNGLDMMQDSDQQQQNNQQPMSSVFSSMNQALEKLNQMVPSSEELGMNNNNNQDSQSSSSSSQNNDNSNNGNNNNYHNHTSPTRSHSTSPRHSIISAEAIPTALGAPLYHLTRPNFTVNSIMSTPPKRSSPSPVARVAVQYLQKGLKSLSSTIFSRQNKNWARRLGLSSVFLSGLLYGASVLQNPGAPLPTNGLEVLQALTRNKRRKSKENVLLPPIDDATRFAAIIGGRNNGADGGGIFNGIDGQPHMQQAILDNNIVNLLYQQPHLIPIIEQLIQQEQQQRDSAAAASAMSNVATLATGKGSNSQRGSPPTSFTSYPIQTAESPIEIISYNDAARARKRLDHGVRMGRGFFPIVY